MKITSLDAAFEEIEKLEERVPVEAIEFLQNHERNERILDKISFSLRNAYDESIYYDPSEDFHSPAPLWYAVVAEEHLCEELLEPIIEAALGSENDWDYLNDQINFLVGKTCEELGEIAIQRCLDTIEKYIHKESPTTTFLSDCLYYADTEKTVAQIHRILEKGHPEQLELFFGGLNKGAYKQTLPRLKELLADFEKLTKKEQESFPYFYENELRVVIESIESGDDDDYRSFYRTRSHWKKAYENMYDKSTETDPKLSLLDSFFPPSKETKQGTIVKGEKVGRNDPCPCGSGKKYKKCCG